MNEEYNKHRRDFLSTSAKTGVCLVCGGMMSAMLSACDTVDEGEPLIHIDEYPELQKIGGAVKKRYRSLNNSEAILVIRTAADQFAVYSALCTHKGVEVRLPQNGEIVCPNHGSRFRVSDGGVIEGKAIEPLLKLHSEFDPKADVLRIG